MKVTLTEARKIRHEYEVNLPLYSKHDCSGDDYTSIHYMCTRLAEDNKTVQRITLNYANYYRGKDAWTIEFSSDVSLDGGEVDYVLGLGEHELEYLEWREQLRLCKEWLIKNSILDL